MDDTTEKSPQGLASDASVIICAYTLDRWDLLLRSIASVQEQRPSPAEILVVVDHNPELGERLRRARLEVSLLANVYRPGLSGARTTGTERASGSILLYLDDDAEASADWIAGMVAPFTCLGVAGVGGWVEPRWSEGRPRWFPQTFNWVVGCSYDGLPASGGFIRNPIGAAMAIRRELVLEAGAFNQSIGRVGTDPVGCEETELCIRICQLHPEMFFVQTREATVVHHVTPERGRFGYFARRCLAEGSSKGMVSRLVGQHDALSSERAHLARAVPRRIYADLLDGEDHVGGASRAAAAVIGTLLTALAYGKASFLDSCARYLGKDTASQADPAYALRDARAIIKFRAHRRRRLR